MKCMIVDDEPMAIKVIENHLQHLEGLEVVATHHNAMDAMLFLQKNPVDLLFLDIQMPKMSGLSLLKTLNKKPHIVLTTAYRDYALEGYELDIIDYLLKPISFERFVKAIAKVYRLDQRLVSHPIVQAPSVTLTEAPFIYIKCDRQNVKILLQDILYIESIKNHIRIFTPEKNYITLLTISQVEEKLPPQHFIRIHRSFIVAISKIDQFTNGQVTISEKTLPIGRHYKQEVMRRLNVNLI